MALLGLLLVVAVKALVTNGFGFQVAPFQMEVQLPAGGGGPFQGLGSPFGGLPSPLMSMMSFPPVFNPMEAMGRDDMAGDSRMDVNGPMGNVTTKNKTENKDGFKVTTITSDGPGFHSYIKEYEKEGNGTSNATTGDEPAGPPPGIAKLLSPGKIFDIMNQLRNMGKKPQKCKKCGAGKFCDPIFHLCRKKFAAGRTCMAQKQCGTNLRCQWGKCQKAKKGDPGTFCKGNGQCNGDSCCRNTPGSFHLMCIPPQQEGSICGLHERQESVAKLFYVVKRSTVTTCSPCKSGLKCANTGDAKFKRCVKSAYTSSAEQEEEDEEESGEEDEEGEEDQGLPSDIVVDNPLQPQHQQQQLTSSPQQPQQPQTTTTTTGAETSSLTQQKPIKGVFEGSVKPPKPEESSAKPMGPLHQGQQNQPKDPTKTDDDENDNDDDKGSGKDDAEEEEEEEEGGDKNDKKEDKEEFKEEEKSGDGEEEEEEEEEDKGSGVDTVIPPQDLPIPTKGGKEEKKKGKSA